MIIITKTTFSSRLCPPHCTAPVGSLSSVGKRLTSSGRARTGAWRRESLWEAGRLSLPIGQQRNQLTLRGREQVQTRGHVSQEADRPGVLVPVPPVPLPTCPALHRPWSNDQEQHPGSLKKSRTHTFTPRDLHTQSSLGSTGVGYKLPTTARKAQCSFCKQ